MKIATTLRLEERQYITLLWMDVTLDGIKLPAVHLASHDDPIIILDMHKLVDDTMTYGDFQKKWGFALTVLKRRFSERWSH